MDLQLEMFEAGIRESIALKNAVLADSKLMWTIREAAECLLLASQNGNRIIFAGNGGSAADAQHLAAEFVSRFAFDRPALPALSLSTDTSIITAIGNDYGYEKLFARQIQAQARQGDVFVGITTSGKSPNILNAFEACRPLGVKTVAMTGDCDELPTVVDYVLKMPSKVTARIQEAHILIGHLLCGYVERKMFR